MRDVAGRLLRQSAEYESIVREFGGAAPKAALEVKADGLPDPLIPPDLEPTP